MSQLHIQIFGLLLFGLFLVLVQEGEACCGGGPACEDDWPYWKRRIAAARKAKSSPSVAGAKKDKEPAWGPWGELICFNCKTQSNPKIPNAPHYKCYRYTHPLPLPNPPDPELSAWSVRTSCKPVDEFVRCLCNTNTISYACQYQDLMMQGCRMLERLKPCVDKYANVKAINKMWECDTSSMEKKFASVPKKAQTELASVLSGGNCDNFWSLNRPASKEGKMKRTPYLMMLTQRLMMIMAGAQPALEWALRRQTCDYWNRPITESKEQEDGEKMFFNITG